METKVEPKLCEATDLLETILFVGGTMHGKHRIDHGDDILEIKGEVYLRTRLQLKFKNLGLAFLECFAFMGYE